MYESISATSWSLMNVSPTSRVPFDWVHPALQRQWARRGKLRTPRQLRLSELEEQRRTMEETQGRMEKILSEKKLTIEKLEQQLAKVKEDMEDDEKAREELARVLQRLSHQMAFHETLPQRDTRSFGTVDGSGAAEAARCAISVSYGGTWGTVASCFPCDNEVKSCFFSQYAAFFDVSAGDSSAALKVEQAHFIDEGCLLSVESASCNSDACPYWHKEQLTHVKLAVGRLVCRAADITRGDGVRCDAAAAFQRFRAAIEASTTLPDAIRIARDMINCTAALGWAQAFLLRERTVSSGREGRYQAPPPRPCIAWDAPLLPRVSVPLMSKLYTLLRVPQEWHTWKALMDLCPSTIVAETLALFQRQKDVVSWRCLMRVAGDTPERLLWLASRGIDIFPVSPSIRLSHIFALLHCGTKPSECVDVCLESVQILSAHAAKCTLSSSRGTQWSERAARYIAYMIAMLCVRIANGDAEAALRLLTYVVKVPGRVCVLPFAQQNLTLMFIVLRQMGNLKGADRLPLASISDVAFTLSEHFSAKLSDECGGLLSRQLSMSSGCAEAGISTELTDRMQSAIYVSLMRTFSSDTALVEQVLATVKAHSILGLTEVWCDYLRIVRQHDDTESLTSLIRLLLDECKDPLLILHLVKILDFHGENTAEVAKLAVERFAESNGIQVDDIAKLALKSEISNPVNVWLPIILLYARGLPPLHRVELILNVPTSLYCEIPELVFLLWFEVIPPAILLRDDQAFRRCTEHGLALFREPFLHHFSPVDCCFDEMVALPHVASLALYRAVPVLLGAVHHLTSHYRKMVLEVSSELHVVHPSLCES